MPNLHQFLGAKIVMSATSKVFFFVSNWTNFIYVWRNDDYFHADWNNVKFHTVQTNKILFILNINLCKALKSFQNIYTIFPCMYYCHIFVVVVANFARIPQNLRFTTHIFYIYIDLNFWGFFGSRTFSHWNI